MKNIIQLLLFSPYQLLILATLAVISWGITDFQISLMLVSIASGAAVLVILNAFGLKK